MVTGISANYVFDTKYFYSPKSVGEIMVTGIPTMHPETPLAETLDRLLETDKHRVVVVDENHGLSGSSPTATSCDAQRNGFAPVHCVPSQLGSAAALARLASKSLRRDAPPPM
ncbi:CBS domain-containing protein [Roseiflexus sp.]|uniref:CBS domain-containing protein n=1 Tax=Roseiflexus sp. TaxID=2562120 RepID=UPI00398B6745